MRKLALLVLLFFISRNSFAQSSFIWAEGFPASYLSEGTSITTDSSGNILMAGYFQDTLVMGSDTLINNGHLTSLLAKFDLSGSLLWVQTSVAGDAVAYAVATDVNENIYVTGEFSSSQVTFGPYTLFNSQVGQTEAFLVKYDSNGNVLWARSVGGSNNDFARSVAVDPAGNIYLAGWFEETILVIGNDTLHNIYFNTQQNFFLVKYDPSGNIVWTKCAGGQAYVNNAFVTTDLFGHVYLAGSYGGPNIVFENDSLQPSVMMSVHMFLVKYDTSGTETWLKGWENPNGVAPAALTTDHTGKIIVSGNFYSSSQVFGPDTLNGLSAVNAFLAKFSITGNVLWALAPQCTDNLFGLNVATDAADNIFYTGGGYNMISPWIIFGTDTFPIPPGSVDPGFLVEYNDAGSFQCGEVLKTAGDDWFPMTAGPSVNTAYFTGDLYVPSAVFGDDTLTCDAWECAFLFHWGCGKFSSTSAEDHLIPENELTCFPNPATSEVTLSFRLDSRSDVEISLFDMCGKSVFSLTKENLDAGKNSVHLDLSDFPAGIYLCRVTNSSGVGSHVLIVKSN